jgi:hypothetical protein
LPADVLLALAQRLKLYGFRASFFVPMWLIEKGFRSKPTEMTDIRRAEYVTKV